MVELPAELSKLWRVAGADSADSKSDWRSTFDLVGLMLTVPPRHGGYDCTPTNSVTFAGTGGDGVHFSWLLLPDAALDFSPVVMTVPMAFDRQNVIVGANVREFLCLGCRFGYFRLEQLAYDAQRTLDGIAASNSESEAGDDEKALLQQLSQALDLHPWKDAHERFATLQDKYLPMLALAGSADVA